MTPQLPRPDELEHDAETDKRGAKTHPPAAVRPARPSSLVKDGRQHRNRLAGLIGHIADRHRPRVSTDGADDLRD
jgi:hypothetical protein